MKALSIGQLLIFLTISLPSYSSEIFNIDVKNLNTTNCLSQSKTISEHLSKLGVSDYKSLISQNGHAKALKELWETKTKLHDLLREFHHESSFSKGCADQIRSVFFEIRNTEDIIEDNFYRSKKEEIIFPDNAFTENNPHLKINSKRKNFNLLKDLKSGDIILSRGRAYTSAAISSLGEFDTQFSHLSVVYKDDNGKLWTVESHIEVGAFVRPIEEHIEDKNFRTVIYRYDDEYLAYEAAKFIFFKVKNASETKGNIFYDFSFDQEDSQKLFCSEIASHAFDFVSHGEVKIPMFRSLLQARKPHFVKKLGIKVEESFVPSDIEIDPRFELIGEWKNAAIIPDALEKDAILRAMFQWSDEHGYELVQGKGKAFLYRNVAWPLRRVPLLKKYFKNKLPINMTRDLIGYFGVLESVGELLQKKLKIKEAEAIKSRGMPLLNSEKYEALENFRLEDETLRKTKLHKMFRPKK